MKTKTKESILMVLVFIGYCIVSSMDYADQVAMEQHRKQSSQAKW